jgi:hypothetical protein
MLMRLSVVCLLATNCCIHIGCSAREQEKTVQIGSKSVSSFPLDHTIDDVKRHGTSQIKPGNSFVLRYGFGSGANGFNILAVDGDGGCEYIFAVRSASSIQWKKAKYAVTSQDLAELCDLLNDIDFLALPAEYHSKRRDGIQVTFHLSYEEGTKQIYCNNHFPDDLRRLASHIETFHMEKLLASLRPRAIGCLRVNDLRPFNEGVPGLRAAEKGTFYFRWNVLIAFFLS